MGVIDEIPTEALAQVVRYGEQMAHYDHTNGTPGMLGTGVFLSTLAFIDQFPGAYGPVLWRVFHGAHDTTVQAYGEGSLARHHGLVLGLYPVVPGGPGH